MSTVHTQAPAEQAVRAEDHTPKRSDRGGPVRQEPRWAGGLTLPNPQTQPSIAVSWQVLGNNAATAGQRADAVQRRRSEARADRMRWRRTVRKIAGSMCGCTDIGEVEHKKCYLERMARCGLGRVESFVQLRLKATEDNGRRASFKGLETCKSLSCPVCCGFIREGVAEKLADGCRRWDIAGHAALYFVLTIPHQAADNLQGMYAMQAAAWRRITGSRRWRELREQLGFEYVRTIEITHGENGWHPHQNILVIAKDVAVVDLVAKVYPVLWELWERECDRAGVGKLSAQHGVHVEVVQSAQRAADYIVKDFGIGREMLRGDIKRGRGGSRTFFQIVASYRDRENPADLALIDEYIRATRGRRMLQPSRGFWKLLGSVGVEEISEEELAEDPGGDEMGRLTADSWDRIVRTWWLDAEVLKAAETGGLDAVSVLLARYGEYLVTATGEIIRPPGVSPPPGPRQEVLWL
jgi:hypothetical protein